MNQKRITYFFTLTQNVLQYNQGKLKNNFSQYFSSLVKLDEHNVNDLALWIASLRETTSFVVSTLYR